MACAITLIIFWLIGVCVLWSICHVGKRGDRE